MHQSSVAAVAAIGIRMMLELMMLLSFLALAAGLAIRRLP